MKTKLTIALLLCCLVTACGGDEQPQAPAAQEEAFKMIEAFGELQQKGDYEKAWEYLSAGRQEVFVQLLTRPVTGARETVANLRPLLEPDSKAEASEKDRVKGILEKYPAWETLKNMTPKQYYAWRMNKDIPEFARKQAKAFYHRDNVKEMVLEGDKGYIEWVAKDSQREYLVKEGGSWKIGLNPKQQREYEALKTK